MTTPRTSPADAGFTMPPEWAPQSATWLSWPLSETIWTGWKKEVNTAMATFAAAISRFQPVCINAAAEAHAMIRDQLNRARADLDQITLFDHPTNDVWCRDHGPIFLKHRETGRLAVADWQFNAWGGKFSPWDKDNAIPGRIAAALNLPCFHFDTLLEGGGIEVNGEGVLLTTEAVMLNPNRNPGLSRTACEDLLKAGFGVETILWLNDGLVEDDTDGHIDNLARFFRPDGIVAVVQEDRSDPDYRPLTDNLERLRSFRTNTGQPYLVVELPQPKPVIVDERRVPASYANFILVNGAVLVPAFGQPRSDDEAAGVLGDCFPGRDVVSLDCRVFLLEGGALHCLSQQQPA